MESKSFILVQPKHFTITTALQLKCDWETDLRLGKIELRTIITTARIWISFNVKHQTVGKDLNHFVFLEFQTLWCCLANRCWALSPLVTVSIWIKNLRDDEMWFKNSAIILKSWLMKHFHGYFVSKGSRPRDSVVFSLTPLIERMGPQMFEKRPNPEMRGPALLPPGQSHTCTTTRPVMECQIKPQTCQHAFGKPNQDLNHCQCRVDLDL